MDYATATPKSELVLIHSALISRWIVLAELLQWVLLLSIILGMRCSGRKLFHGIPGSGTAYKNIRGQVSRWLDPTGLYHARRGRWLACKSILGHAYLTNIDVLNHHKASMGDTTLYKSPQDGDSTSSRWRITNAARTTLQNLHRRKLPQLPLQPGQSAPSLGLNEPRQLCCWCEVSQKPKLGDQPELSGQCMLSAS